MSPPVQNLLEPVLEPVLELGSDGAVVGLHKLHAEIFAHASGWHENPGINSWLIETGASGLVSHVVDAQKLSLFASLLKSTSKSSLIMQPGTSELAKKQDSTVDTFPPIEGSKIEASIAAGLPDVYSATALANFGWHVFVESVTQSEESLSADALYAVHALAQLSSASRHVCAATLHVSCTAGHTDGDDTAA